MRLRDNNKLDEALRDYNKAVELKPNSRVAYYNRGNLFRNQERNDEALNDYSKAITLKPDFAEAYVNRGIIKLNSGKKDSACIDFQKAAGFGLKLGTEKFNKNCR